MVATLNTLRHDAVFNATSWRGRIDIVGAGATGGATTWLMANLGLGHEIHVHDDDVVEPHNLANQVYGPDDVGKRKVDALASFIERQTGAAITVHPERVEGPARLGRVVILCVDSMASRRLVYEQSVRHKPNVHLLLDPRMSSNNGMVVSADPRKPASCAAYEALLYDDDQAQAGGCSMQITVCSVAMQLAAFTVNRFLTWAREEHKRTRPMPLNETLWSAAFVHGTWALTADVPDMVSL